MDNPKYLTGDKALIKDFLDKFDVRLRADHLYFCMPGAFVVLCYEFNDSLVYTSNQEIGISV